MMKICSFVLILITLASWTIDGRSDVIQSPQDHLRDAYNHYHLELLRTGPQSSQTKKSQENLDLAFSNFQKAGPLAPSSWTPAWATETLDVGDAEVSLTDLGDKLTAWLKGSASPRTRDLAFHFMPTDDNAVEVLSGNNEYWPRLLSDLSRAHSSINVQMYGITADPWVWEFARLLAKKADEGVKVRILADRVGARMLENTRQKTLRFFVSDYNDKSPSTRPLFDFLKSNGVDVVFISPGFGSHQIHIDHRKYYVIDGKIAYNTGYTLEGDMRFKKFDEGLRLTGSVVRQIQMSFFANYLHAGGKLDVTDPDAFLKEYFPPVEADEKGSTVLSLQYNIPDVRSEISETYLNAINHAKKYVYVVTPYFASGQINKALKQAAQRGVDVRVVVPRIPVDGYYGAEDDYIFEGFLKDHIKPYIYDGPENYGLLHGKGLVADGEIASVGSCNMDPFSLFFNSEQNITTRDPVVVGLIEKKIFEHLFLYSHLYQAPVTKGGRVRTKIGGVAVDVLRGLLELDE